MIFLNLLKTNSCYSIEKGIQLYHACDGESLRENEFPFRLYENNSRWKKLLLSNAKIIFNVVSSISRASGMTTISTISTSISPSTAWKINFSNDYTKSISSNKTNLKALYDYIEKKNSLSTTALESPGTVSNQKEEEDSLWLERNEKEGWNLIDTGQVKREVRSYLEFMVKHSKNLILGINRRGWISLFCINSVLI